MMQQDNLAEELRAVLLRLAAGQLLSLIHI